MRPNRDTRFVVSLVLCTSPATLTHEAEHWAGGRSSDQGYTLCHWHKAMLLPCELRLAMAYWCASHKPEAIIWQVIISVVFSTVIFWRLWLFSDLTLWSQWEAAGQISERLLDPFGASIPWTHQQRCSASGAGQQQPSEMLPSTSFYFFSGKGHNPQVDVWILPWFRWFLSSVFQCSLQLPAHQCSWWPAQWLANGDWLCPFCSEMFSVAVTWNPESWACPTQLHELPGQLHALAKTGTKSKELPLKPVHTSAWGWHPRCSESSGMHCRQKQLLAHNSYPILFLSMLP